MNSLFFCLPQDALLTCAKWSGGFFTIVQKGLMELLIWGGSEKGL